MALGKSWGLIAFTASECLVLWHGLTLCSAWPSPREGPASCYSVPSQESSSRRRAGFKDTVVNLGKSTWGVTQMLGAWGFALSPPSHLHPLSAQEFSLAASSASGTLALHITFQSPKCLGDRDSDWSLPNQWFGRPGSGDHPGPISCICKGGQGTWYMYGWSSCFPRTVGK